MAGTKVVVDFKLWGALTPISLDQTESQWGEGAPGFKAFMADSEPAYPRPTTAGCWRDATAARLGALMLVHAENNSLLKANEDRLRRKGRTDAIAHHESRPSPDRRGKAVHRALFLAGHAGARCQIVHSSCPGSVELVKLARRQEKRATIEVCSHHLLLDLGDLKRLGPFGRCAPALRDRALVEKMWDHV
jgi:dihydroorotase-like cyclic amidohydrolase